MVEQDRTLTRTERFLSHLLDAASFAVLSTDQQGSVLTFNAAAEKIYGRSRNEVAGSNISAIFPEEGEAFPPEGVRTKHTRKNGDVFPVLLRRSDIRDTDGREIAHLYVCEDLSAKEQMESQLEYAERLSLLGQLAPRIAHEFKTPIQVIMGNAELAASLLAADKPGKALESIAHIPDAAREMLELVQQMSNLGKPTKEALVTLDLREELDKTLVPLAQLGVIKYCKIVKEYEDPLPGIVADPGQIEQVFRNLLVNAAQAMETGGDRILTLHVKRSDEGRSVKVSVGDTGPGIPADMLEEIFHPFFTTTPVGKGTGLGLAIVKTIVERHLGDVSVTSEKGEGTCFTLLFPVTTGEDWNASTQVHRDAGELSTYSAGCAETDRTSKRGS